jgi:UDP-glucuronate 4-epimerase
MKTIVTGGAGFIGSHLVDRLLDLGATVTVVDNFDPFYDRAQKESNLRDAQRNPRFRLIERDIRDARAAHEIVEECRPDAIIHLAARAGVRPSIALPRLYTEVNVLGTLAYLEAACRLEPRPRFIYASSSSVYGDRDTGPFRESDPAILPVSPYAATKRSCELLAHTFHHLYRLPVTGLRFFTSYGPRNRPDLAVAKFTRLVDQGLPVPMFGDGSSRRDYTYVLDIVDGIVRAIDHCSTEHLYNLGNAQPIALRSLIAEIAAALGKPADVETLPDEPGDVRQTFAAIDRAADELGYAPKTPLAEGLRQYVAWYRSNEAGIA